MKSFTALFALDVPHYGTEIIEAETPAQAVEIAKHLNIVDTYLVKELPRLLKGYPAAEG
jgi:hypothetical protein